MSNSSPSEEGYDPAGCRSLGLLIGKGGGAFGGAWISNDSLVEYAMNDLRNKAAELGANYIRYDAAQMGVASSGGKYGGSTTTTATVSGTAYACAKRTTSDGAPVAAAPVAAAPVAAAPVAAAPVAAAPVAATAPSKAKAPRGAAGYAFGASVEDVRVQCSRKHEWSALGENSFACAGTPKDVGTKGQSLLDFCDGALCKIDLVVRPDGGASTTWLAEYNRLHEALDARYGVPKDRWQTLPPDCRKDDMLSCFKRGAWLESRWEFEDRTRVTLQMTDKPGPDVAIHVIYALDQGPAL